MRIAVTYDNGQVFQHFGHTKNFKIYDAEDGKITSASVIDTEGNGHGALAEFLKKQDVDTLLCGGIGDGAKQALAEAGIQLFGGVTGETDKVVEDLLADRLEFNPDVKCSHHGENHHAGHHHGEHHGEHNHGEHK